jgi:hypothetical protein
METMMGNAETFKPHTNQKHKVEFNKGNSSDDKEQFFLMYNDLGHMNMDQSTRSKKND